MSPRQSSSLAPKASGGHKAGSRSRLTYSGAFWSPYAPCHTIAVPPHVTR